MTRSLLLICLLALPLHAQLRAAARGGLFFNAGNDIVGTVELEARRGNWSIAPALDLIRGGYGLHAIHVDARRLFESERNTFWIGAGPTFVRTNAQASETTFNLDAGMAWRKGHPWQPFVAARYYAFRMPVSHETVDADGAVVSMGISMRVH